MKTLTKLLIIPTLAGAFTFTSPEKTIAQDDDSIYFKLYTPFKLEDTLDAVFTIFTNDHPNPIVKNAIIGGARGVRCMRTGYSRQTCI